MRTHVCLDPEAMILPEYFKHMVTVACESGLVQQQQKKMRHQKGKDEQEADLCRERPRRHLAPMLCPMLQTLMGQVGLQVIDVYAI